MKVKLSEAIANLKGLITKYEESQKPVKFMDAELKDGSKIKIEPALEKGAKVMVITPEGEVEAPAGAHEIVTPEGIITIKVEGGIISEDPSAPVPVTDLKDDKKPTNVDEALGELKKIAEVVNLFRTQLAAVTKENTTLKTKLAAVEKSLVEAGKIQSETFKIMEALSEAPGASATEDDKKHSRMTRFETLADNLAKLNSKK